MIDAKVLVAVLLGFILKEDPNIGRHEKLQTQFNDDISQMVKFHMDVADGTLVSKDVDVLILSSVNYRENRMRLPAPSGDCHMEHRLQSVPSMKWPKGYVPVYKQVCHAVGPMQIAMATRNTIAGWPEVQAVFKERVLAAEGFEERDFPFSKEEVEDPYTNVRLGYGNLAHWKAACLDRHGQAPVGVWLTAYRYGKCPAKQKNSGKYYIDDEAKKRCALISDMIKALPGLDAPSSYACTYTKE